MSQIQGADVKTEADLIAAGADKTYMIRDTQIYITAKGINETLDDAINLGRIGGGGGLVLTWCNDGDLAWSEQTLFGQKVYGASPSAALGDQKLWTSFKLPSTYAAGTQVKIKGKIFSDSTSGTGHIKTVAYLIRQGTDSLTSTSNSRTSTNSAQSISNTNREYVVDWDISHTDGTINSVALSANDTILIYLSRETGDGNTSEIFFMPNTSEVII